VLLAYLTHLTLYTVYTGVTKYIKLVSQCYKVCIQTESSWHL